MTFEKVTHTLMLYDMVDLQQSTTRHAFALR